MGYAERKYADPMGRPPSRLAGAPVVKWLLIVNIAIFVLDLLGRPPSESGHYNPSVLGEWGAFTIDEGLSGLQLWRLVTFQFLHADFLHLLFNMYALFLFGPFIERWWRSRRFLGFYLLCGAAGALFFVLLAHLDILDTHVKTLLVGASAGIYGILIATAVIAPEGRIMLLFPPIPMKMRTFALVFIGIGVFVVLTNGNNAGGEAGHLGGALAGFLLMKFPRLLDPLERRRQRVEVIRPKAFRRRPPKLRPRSGYVPGSETQVDAILDKINREGFGSLTAEEKETLRRAAEEGRMG